MGLFDLFKGKEKRDGSGAKSNPAAKWAQTAGNKRAQNYDRQEALTELAAMGTPEAAAALLKRFTFHMDPSITDQDEKEIAFQGVLRAERGAIEPVRAFAAKAESLAWPMKILKELVTDDELVDELLVWLSRWDTEYSKFIDPKIQILVALEDFSAGAQHEKIRAAVEPFLEDVNEPARFHAAATLLAQNDPGVIGPLLKVLVDEESVRVRNKIAEGFIAHEWAVPEEQREPVRKALPPPYSIDGDGQLRKR